jgi:hypothetical protein
MPTETISWASWLRENWYWLVLLWLALFAIGAYLNWEREKRRARLNDAGLATMLGDQPGAGGAMHSYGDAELPIPAPKKPPIDQA